MGSSSMAGCLPSMHQALGSISTTSQTQTHTVTIETHTHRHTHAHTDTRETHMHGHTHVHTDTRETHTDRETHMHGHTQTHSSTDTETHTHPILRYQVQARTVSSFQTWIYSNVPLTHRSLCLWMPRPQTPLPCP